jgi:uncharacterized membrane protein YecN with MAPEG domain
MSFQVTAIYASILTVWMIALANVVSAKRGQTGISILHGDNKELALWIRRHGNLAENLAVALLLMALCEARGLSSEWLHAMGVLLVIARVAHAIGLDPARPAAPLRLAGGIGTQLAMLGAVVYLVWSQF